MIILVVIGMFFGIDPRVLLGLAGTVETVQQQVAPQKIEGKQGPVSDPLGAFVAGVLLDTEKTWNTLFAQLGKDYQEPRLVLFDGATPTACGTGQAAMGPFYCPLDQRVYIDLAFYRHLQERFRAPGTLRRRTSSPTKSVTTCRISWASCRRWTSTVDA